MKIFSISEDEKKQWNRNLSHLSGRITWKYVPKPLDFARITLWQNNSTSTKFSPRKYTGKHAGIDLVTKMFN